MKSYIYIVFVGEERVRSVKESGCGRRGKAVALRHVGFALLRFDIELPYILSCWLVVTLYIVVVALTLTGL